MIFRKTVRVSAFILLGMLLLGDNACSAAPQISEAPVNSPILRMHWIGKNQISKDTNSATLMGVWNMPESGDFETQALKEFSFLSGRILFETNQPSSDVLVPLLREIVRNESYIEARQPAGVTSPSAEMVLAIRLDAQQSSSWDTNLAAILKSSGSQPVPGNRAVATGDKKWSLKKRQAPNLFEFARSGEWTIVGIAQDTNALFEQTLERIGKTHSPSPMPATNFWLEAQIDLPGISQALGRRWNPPLNLPTISATVAGVNNKVYTTAELRFRDFSTAPLEPWAIPTNFIQTDLTSFTAARGIVAPLLKSLPAWNESGIQTAPDQFCVWALFGFPMQTYFAAPLRDSSNVVSHVSDVVLQKEAQWKLTNGLARFEKSTTYNGLKWAGVPYMVPFLLSTNAMGRDFVFGGLFLPETTYPASEEVFKEIYSRTNLVYYDWDLTGRRIEQLIYIGQLLRLVAEKPQLPVSSPGILWLKALVPKLGDAFTTCTATDKPGEFKLVRKSNIGLTAIELERLVRAVQSIEDVRSGK
jgi:hypothetical protein